MATSITPISRSLPSGTVFYTWVNIRWKPTSGGSGFGANQQLAHAKVFGHQEFLWFALHVAGVMAMFWAILEAVLSMSFYAFVSGVTADDQSGWLMRRAARYGRNPLRRFVGLVVLLVLAYALVDGVAFVFMTQKLPVLAQELLN
ncbi:MAG: hypothetical protein IMZ72_09225, partial [Cutibacterium acnes]|nr:hypothetical protein [Cutibacterium acnes]